MAAFRASPLAELIGHQACDKFVPEFYNAIYTAPDDPYNNAWDDRSNVGKPDLVPGKVTSGIDAILVHPGSISGTVATATGSQLQSFCIVFQGPGGGFTRLFSDTTSYEIPDLSPGLYYVQFWTPTCSDSTSSQGNDYHVDVFEGKATALNARF